VLIHDSYLDVRLFLSLLHGFNCCNGLWCHYLVCLTRSRRACYRTNAIHELLSPLIHLLWWQTSIAILKFHLLMNFDGFHPFTTLFFFGACCKWGHNLYTTTTTTTVLLCCIAALYYHLLATLHTMSIIVVNLQDSRAVFKIFIALLRFSFDSPSYLYIFAYFVLRD
jgi:hypothetical protein